MNYAIAGLLVALLTFSGSNAQPDSLALPGPVPDSTTTATALGDLPSVQVAIPHDQDDALVSFNGPNGTAFVANPAYAPIALGAGFQLVIHDFPLNAEVASIAVYASGVEVAKGVTDPISKGFNTEAESQGFEVFPNVAITGVPVVPGNSYTLRLLSASGEVLHETSPLALTSDNAHQSGYWMTMPSRPSVQWGATDNVTLPPQIGDIEEMSAGPSPSYTFCEFEGYYCSFTGRRDVAYGASSLGMYNYRYGVTGGINCTNAVFGDPAPGMGKACFISGDTGTTYTPPSGYSSLCAYEAQYCIVSGTMDVAYGNSGSYLYKYGITGGTTCSATNFGGDPIIGVHKACWMKPGNPGGGTTYTPPPGYSTLCAYEGQYCSGSGTVDIAYGNSGYYLYQYSVNGGTTCSSSSFGGDPIYGVHKACWTKPSDGGGYCPGNYNTWATQTVNPRYVNTYGNTLNTNHDSLASEAWTVKYDYGYYQGTCGNTLDSNLNFGYANDFAGKSDLVGRGIFGYTYTLDYRGGKDMTTQCVGGTCQEVGYSMGVSRAEVFMKTPPSQVVPSYRGVSNVNIPQSSGASVPPTVKFALDQMVNAISSWGGIPGQILGFASPNNVQWQTYSSVTANAAGSAGGGLRVNTQVFGDQKIVSGQMDWNYGGVSLTPVVFDYELQPTIKEDSMFHACFDCNWVEGHKTWYTNMKHQARFRLA